MCWISTRKDGKAIAKVAKKDIPIIKIGHRRFNQFESAAYAYGYKMRELQEPIKIKPFGGAIYVHEKRIERGYHFYKPGMIHIKHVINPSLLIICGILRGIRIHHYQITKTSCIAKGYVPKGTTYYLNEDGEGVAEQIILTEMIDLNDYLTNKKLSKL